MNIVDSSGWLSYFGNARHAASFALPIEKTEELLVPSITLAEVFKMILRQKSESAALSAVAHMQRGRVVDLDARIALEAAALGHRYRLPMADSVIYATGRLHHALVWTQDSDFENLEGVKYFKT